MVNDKIIAVINTSEQISEVLEDQFSGCTVHEQVEEVTIEGIRYYYYTIPVLRNPVRDLTFYYLEEKGK